MINYQQKAKTGSTKNRSKWKSPLPSRKAFRWEATWDATCHHRRPKCSPRWCPVLRSRSFLHHPQKADKSCNNLHEDCRGKVACSDSPTANKIMQIYVVTLSPCLLAGGPSREPFSAIVGQRIALELFDDVVLSELNFHFED